MVDILYPRNRRFGRNVAVGLTVGLFALNIGLVGDIASTPVMGTTLGFLANLLILPWIAIGLWKFKFS